MSSVPNVLNLIVKVTTGCNLACRYCYVDKRGISEPQLMTTATLNNLISKAQASGLQVNYVWHGGEPLLAGADYYSCIARIQQIHRQHSEQVITNCVQTSGPLLTNPVIQTLLAIGFDVGISYDANAPSQEPSRPFASGRETEPIVRRRIQALRNARGSVGVLCVVTRDNVEDASGILRRLSELGVNGVSFLPFKPNPFAPNLSIGSKEWANFLIESFEFWLQPECRIRTVDPVCCMVTSLVGLEPYICTFSGPCFRRYLSVYPQGDVYPCSAFATDAYRLGNVNQVGFEEIFSNPILLDLRHVWMSEVEKRCAGCPYRAICNGGCAEHSFGIRGQVSVCDAECAARRKVFAYLEKRLLHLLPHELCVHFGAKRLHTDHSRGVPDEQPDALNAVPIAETMEVA